MSFYEFNNFDYYAIIGAKTIDEALEYYNKYVSDENGIPDEISYYKAKKNLMFTIKNWHEKFKAHEDFMRNMEKNEPFLILIDNALI